MAGRAQALDSGDNDEQDKKSNKKKSSKYNYSFGTRYPGVVIGHKVCNPSSGVSGYPVPYDMGWLWNVPDFTGMKHRRGWRPGAVGKSMQKVMTFKLPKADKRPREPKETRTKKRKKTGGFGGGGVVDSEPEEPLDPKPALRVKRKGDIYTIEVNPLKDLTVLREREDPYENCDPLVFKIIKKRSPEERAKMEAKKISKLKRERDAEIRRQLSEAAEEICKCAYMDVFCNDYTAIDKKIDVCPAFAEPDCVCKSESMSSLSSNATWDIEYTPPFGCFDTQPKKVKNVVHVATQYLASEAAPDPVKDGKKVKGKKSTGSMKSKKK